MFISIQELELRTVEFDQAFAPGEIEFGPEVTQSVPLKAKGRAELLKEHHGGKNIVKDIRVVGDFSTRMQIHCARCLEPVQQEVGDRFDLLYRPIATLKQAEESGISEAESEIGYFKGDGILLEDVLKEQVLLALPARVICSEGCRGLCPHCGINRNTGTCACEEKQSDPRWSALAEMRDKFKQ